MVNSSNVYGGRVTSVHGRQPDMNM